MGYLLGFLKLGYRRRLLNVSRDVRLYLSWVSDLDIMSYTDILCTLKWSSLSSRRNCLMISFVVKCLFNAIKCESVNRNISVNHRYDSALTFKHLFARTQSLHLNATNRFPGSGQLWSALPVEFCNSVILTSLPSFLKALKHEESVTTANIS